MSAQMMLWDNGVNGGLKTAGNRSKRDSLANELCYLLHMSDRPSKGFQISPAGLVHSFGVCLIEDWNMARGGRKESPKTAASAMPRFVDIPLSKEEKQAFLDWDVSVLDLVEEIQALADEGYRIGVTWSGEHQSYTVSMTGRSEENPNNGLCMTSFARTLPKAVSLMLFKHRVIAQGKWVEASPGGGEEFG